MEGPDLEKRTEGQRREFVEEGVEKVKSRDAVMVTMTAVMKMVWKCHGSPDKAKRTQRRDK